MEQFYEDGHYLFVYIKREIESKSVGIIGFKSKTVKIKCAVKFFYAEAGNNAAIRLLQRRATAAASDAYDWIDSNEAGKWE